MNKKTIHQLIQLNTRFYDQIHDSFSATRQSPWGGWEDLISDIELPNELFVLDLACGNGRFLQFLDENLPSNINIHYLGIDNNSNLLNDAKHIQSSRVEAKFLKLDILEILLEEKSFSKIFKENNLDTFVKNVDLIVSFGFIHHVPAQELRRTFLEMIDNLAQEKTITCISAWQFAHDQRLNKKFISPAKIQVTSNIHPEELEENDYFLPWKNTNAIRYCHQLSLSQAKELIANTQLTLAKDFLADGKSNQLNLYLVLKKQRLTSHQE